MIYEQDYRRYLNKTLTDIDWMVVSVAFTACHLNVSEKSQNGKFVNAMINVYQKFIITKNEKYKKELNQTYLSYFYPEYKKSHYRVSPLKYSSVKVGGAFSPEPSPEKASPKKYQSQLLLKKESPQKKELKDKKIKKIKEDQRDIVIQKLQQQQQILIEMVQTLSIKVAEFHEEDVGQAKEVIENTGKIITMQSRFQDSIKEFKDIINGKLSFKQILSGSIVSLFKHIVYTGFSLTYKIIKFINWDLVVHPIKAASKHLLKPASIILGFIFVIYIGGIFFAYYVGSQDESCQAMGHDFCSTNIIANLYEFPYGVADYIWHSMNVVKQLVIDTPSDIIFNTKDFKFSLAESQSLKHLIDKSIPTHIVIRGNEAWAYIFKHYGTTMSGILRELFIEKGPEVGKDLWKELCKDSYFWNIACFPARFF